jgi:hypothetical protein
MRKSEVKWSSIMRNTMNINIIILKNRMKKRKVSQYYNNDVKISNKNNNQFFLNLRLKFFQFQL